ncbi:MAG: SET domain-containing protein [Pseudomonadota bacterium]
MAKKTTSRAKKKPAVKKAVAGNKSRKVYPPGNSEQVPYDLVYVADSDIHGKGLFARKPIKVGMSLGLLEGKPTTKDGIYVLWLSARKAMTVTNEFKYINHSSQPNCALTGTEVVTLRKIKTHEELTHDYGW